MTGALQHPLVQKIIAYQIGMASGDPDASSVFAPDVVYVVPGANALSGVHHGPDAVMGYFGQLMRRSGGTYRIDAMHWLVCGDKVLLETRNAATVEGRSLTWDEALLFEFRDGRKQRIEMFQADQVAVDVLFGA
jgi:ketosteroid isomerase-like protein